MMNKFTKNNYKRQGPLKVVGGLTKQGKWKHSKTNGNYLFPVKALSSVYRVKYISHLRKQVALFNANNEKQIVLPKTIIESCFKKQWIVYAKKPFSGVNSVVMEFVRRFSLHILPKSFVRIGHYGILSSTSKLKSINEIRKQLPPIKN